MKDGTVVLAYHWQGSYDAEGNWDRSVRKTDTRVVRSMDGGRTWVKDELINYALLTRVTVNREHPPDLTLLSNGWVLLTSGTVGSRRTVQGGLLRRGGTDLGGVVIRPSQIVRRIRLRRDAEDAENPTYSLGLSAFSPPLRCTPDLPRGRRVR